LPFLSLLKVKPLVLVLAVLGLLYGTLYLVNEYQISVEQEESQQEFLRGAEAADDFLLRAKLRDAEAESRSEMLFESDKELLQGIRDMDVELGVKAEQFASDYPGIGE